MKTEQKEELVCACGAWRILNKNTSYGYSETCHSYYSCQERVWKTIGRRPRPKSTFHI
jgi:hypothetical protein